MKRFLASLFLLTALAMPRAASAFANVKWDLASSAVYNANGRVVLTSTTPNTFGGAFNPCPLDITQDFDLSFGMNFGVNACGADGMSFVLKPTAGGQAGSDPGRHAFDGIANALAVGFDTWANTVAPYSDPPYDSLGIQTSATVQNAGPAACGDTGVVGGPTACGRPAISSTQFNIKDGLDHTVRFTWAAATRRLSVYVDADPLARAQWDLPAAYATSIFGGSTSLYFGFTAGTGSGGQNFHSFGLISGTVNGGSRDVSTFTCTAATPVPGASNTPLVIPTSACGTATPMPSFTYSPTPAPPTSTITVSPTPYPPGCGTPVFQEAKVLASGCLGSTGTVTTGVYSFASQPNQLLVLRINTSSNGGTPTGVSFGGSSMALFASSLVGQSDDRHMYTYYLASPPTSGSVSFSYPNANCSWNIVTELYKNVDVSNPVGGSTVKQGGNAGASTPFPFSFTYTTSGFASLISVFMTSDQAACCPPTVSAPLVDMGLAAVGPASIDGGGAEGVAGYYQAVGGPATTTLNFNGSQASRWWDAQPMEIRGNNCTTPTFTATLSQSPSATPSRSSTPSSTLTPSPGPSATSTLTLSATPSFSSTFTRTVSPSDTPSSTFTLSASPTFTPSPPFSATQSPSVTPTSTPTPSFSPSPTFTATPSLTFSATVTTTSTQTATFSATPSVTATPTVSPSFTVSPTFSVSPTITPTVDRFFQLDKLIKVEGLYPNPFSDKLGVYFLLRVDAAVKFAVYNVAGEPIWKTSMAGKAGKNLLFWEGVNDAGGRCASGVYVLRLDATGLDQSTDGYWARAAAVR